MINFILGHLNNIYEFLWNKTILLYKVFNGIKIKLKFQNLIIFLLSIINLSLYILKIWMMILFLRVKKK